MNKRETKRDLAVEAIWGYLNDNPEAADTLEGIVEWWIPQQQWKIAAADIEQVLAEMVSMRYLAAQAGSDGRLHYRLHPDKKQEMQEVLARNLEAKRGRAEWVGQSEGDLARSKGK